MNKRKRLVPVIPRVNKKKKVVVESYTLIEPVNKDVVAASNHVLDLVQDTKVDIGADDIANWAGISSKLVDLIDKYPREKRKEKRNFSGVLLPVVRPVRLKMESIDSLLLKGSPYSPIYLKRMTSRGSYRPIKDFVRR